VGGGGTLTTLINNLNIKTSPRDTMFDSETTKPGEKRTLFALLLLLGPSTDTLLLCFLKLGCWFWIHGNHYVGLDWKGRKTKLWKGEVSLLDLVAWKGKVVESNHRKRFSYNMRIFLIYSKEIEFLKLLKLSSMTFSFSFRFNFLTLTLSFLHHQHFTFFFRHFDQYKLDTYVVEGGFVDF